MSNKTFTLLVREIVTYEVEVEAPTFSEARKAVINPGDSEYFYDRTGDYQSCDIVSVKRVKDADHGE